MSLSPSNRDDVKRALRWLLTSTKSDGTLPAPPQQILTAIRRLSPDSNDEMSELLYGPEVRLGGNNMLTRPGSLLHSYDFGTILEHN
jgi:hypothetical protein